MQQDKRWRSQYPVHVPQRDGEWDRGMIYAWVGQHTQELVDAGPWNGPRVGILRQRAEEVSCRFVIAAGSDFREDEDIRVDSLHGSAPVHEIEQCPSVQNVDPRLQLSIPCLELEPEGPGGLRERQGMAKKVVSHILKGAAFSGGFLLEPAQKVVVEAQGGARHTSKCIT